MADEDAMGPVSYVIAEFPGSQMKGDALAALVDLVDLGLVRVLDLLFVTRGDDGSLSAVELADVDHDGALDMVVFEGAATGLLDESDLADAADAIEPGSSAAILLFENVWARAFTAGVRSGGGQIVAAGYVPVDALVASLDAAEAGD